LHVYLRRDFVNGALDMLAREFSIAKGLADAIKADEGKEFADDVAAAAELAIAKSEFLIVPPRDDGEDALRADQDML